MPRVDKTQSAVSVTRAALAADIVQADWNKLIPLGINASGKAVKGAGNSGVIGVGVFDRTNYRAGQIADIIGNGSEIVGLTGLVAGTKYYSDAAGVVSTTNTGTYLGYTVEADRLIVMI